MKEQPRGNRYLKPGESPPEKKAINQNPKINKTQTRTKIAILTIAITAAGTAVYHRSGDIQEWQTENKQAETDQRRIDNKFAYITESNKAVNIAITNQIARDELSITEGAGSIEQRDDLMATIDLKRNPYIIRLDDTNELEVVPNNNPNVPEYIDAYYLKHTQNKILVQDNIFVQIDKREGIINVRLELSDPANKNIAIDLIARATENPTDLSDDEKKALASLLSTGELPDNFDINAINAHRKTVENYSTSIVNIEKRGNEIIVLYGDLNFYYKIVGNKVKVLDKKGNVVEDNPENEKETTAIQSIITLKNHDTSQYDAKEKQKVYNEIRFELGLAEGVLTNSLQKRISTQHASVSE